MSTAHEDDWPDFQLETGDCGHIVDAKQVCPACGLCFHCCTCHDQLPSIASMIDSSEAIL